MSALVLWRDTAKKASGVSSRPSSPPLSDDEDEDKNDVLSADERQDHKRSKSEPPEQGITMRKPTSSSWVRWWGRSRINKEAEVNGKGGRPSLKASSSAPFEAVSVVALLFLFLCKYLMRRLVAERPTRTECEGSPIK